MKFVFREVFFEEPPKLDLQELSQKIPRKEALLKFASVSLSAISENQKPSVNLDRKESFSRAVLQVLKWNPFSWENRLPFFEDATPEESLSALNHVYAGTVARTLSQVLKNLFSDLSLPQIPL